MFRYLEKINSLALVGATGLVGREFIDLLDEYKIRIPKLKLLASENSLGEFMTVGGQDHGVEQLGPSSFNGVDVAFFTVPSSVSRQFIPGAVEQGCTVVDDSSLYRLQPGVPLIVPQVNGEVLKNFKGGILTTPNCTTTPLAMVLKPLQDTLGLSRVVVSTYQSVSGAGRRALEELSSQTQALMNGQTIESQVFPHRIAFNCLPMIGGKLENGNSEEEEKVIGELRKILDLPNLRVSATAIRVPTFGGHGLSANIEFEKDFESIEAIREVLEGFPGVRVIDRPDSHIYPTNEQCIKVNETLVGRIRVDRSVPSGINLWIVSDNLRKGAALNALEILDTLYGYWSIH